MGHQKSFNDPKNWRQNIGNYSNKNSNKNPKNISENYSENYSETNTFELSEQQLLQLPSDLRNLYQYKILNPKWQLKGNINKFTFFLFFLSLIQPVLTNPANQNNNPNNHQKSIPEAPKNNNLCRKTIANALPKNLNKNSQQISEVLCKLNGNFSSDLEAALAYQKQLFPKKPVIKYDEKRDTAITSGCGEDHLTGFRRWFLVFTPTSLHNILIENIFNLTRNIAHELSHFYPCMLADNLLFPADGDLVKLEECEDYFTIYVRMLEVFRTQPNHPNVLSVVDLMIEKKSQICILYQEFMLRERQITISLTKNSQKLTKTDFVRWFSNTEWHRMKKYQNKEQGQCAELIANILDRYGKLPFDQNAVEILNEFYKNAIEMSIFSLKPNLPNLTERSALLGIFANTTYYEYKNKFEKLNTKPNEADSKSVKKTIS